MSITEFLLARIAEDEADWRAVDARDVVQLLQGKPLAPRMLAECEAKRRIVELSVSWRDHAERFATKPDAVSAVLEAQAITGETVVRTLARAWSDHPDYREEEWRS